MWYDAIMLAIIVMAAMRGAAKGIVWQLASLGAIVLCFAFATQLSVLLSPFIGVAPPLDRWIAMIVIYVLCSFASFAAARVLRGWIERAKFVEYDRHLGGILGFVKGVAICLLLTFFAVTLSQSAREAILNSHSGYAAAIIMDRLHPVMPKELHDVLEPYIHHLDRPDADLRHAHEPREAGARERLLHEIAAVCSDFPAAQEAIAEEIDLAISGLPDEIALAVLNDWISDLLARSPDPDAETDMTTALDARIVRQLSKADIPLTSLGQALRERLSESLLR